MISIIAAMADDRIIGMDNSMPWNLPSDLEWFKKQTINKPVIMGRRTFESIGRPLPSRINIMVSRSICEMPGIQVAKSIDDALKIVENAPEIMIIGGGDIYSQTLDRADRLYLTHIDAQIEGDTRFPDYNPNNWKTIFSEFHDSNHRDSHNFCFEILDRAK